MPNTEPNTGRSTAAQLLLAAFAGFFGSIFATGVYQSIATGPNHQPLTPHQTVCMFAIEAAAGLVVIQLFDRVNGENFLKLRNIPKGFIAAILGSAIVIPLVFVITLLVQAIMTRMGIKEPEEHQLLLVFQRPVILDRLLVILSAVVFAPLFEEMAFRAHLQAGIRKATSMPWLAIAITSALFALVHQIWWTMPPLFVLAIGLGFVYDRTRNIWACVFTHAMFNALSLTIEYVSMKHT